MPLSSEDIWKSVSKEEPGREASLDGSSGSLAPNPPESDNEVEVERLVRKEDFRKWWDAIGARLRPTKIEDMKEFSRRVCFEAWQQRGLLIPANAEISHPRNEG